LFDSLGDGGQQGPNQPLVENITHRQSLVRLQRKLGCLHPAEIAHILEALPLSERLYLSEDEACEAAHAFERYDLVSAPVVDNNGVRSQSQIVQQHLPQALAWAKSFFQVSKHFSSSQRRE